MTFLDPPSFQTGDVLSASKLNHMLTDIDTLYGWHYGAWYGCDKQQYRTTQNDTTVEGWAGWLILTGDTLVVHLSHFVAGTGEIAAKVYFDDVLVGNPAGYTSDGVKTIPLPIGANGWSQWTPYRVKVITERTSTSSGAQLDVENVYIKDSSVPSTGTMPAFNDEEASTAADFNAISDGIRTVEPTFVQPVAGCWGGVEYKTQGGNTGWTTVHDWRIQHRLNGVRVSLFIQGATGAAISARIMYNGTMVNGASWTVAAGAPPLRVTDEIFAVPAGLTVGNFYNLYLQIKQSQSWEDWFVRPLHVYEDQIGLPAGYNATTRWTHGDYGIGDADPAGAPMLFDMSNNMEYLNARSTAAGVVNVAQREPIDTFSFPYWLSADRRVYHVRRWRWLAYKKQPWYTEQGSNGLPVNINPTINWTYDGITWQSYTLPDLDGEGGFYDLDNSPIAQGMTFYATGVQYAIQTPQTY